MTGAKAENQRMSGQPGNGMATKTARRLSLSRLARVGKNLARAGIRKANPWLVHISLQDRLGNLANVKSSREHLDATIKWLCRAQDRYGGFGVSAGYSFLDGWYPPYPETTGYLIPTFYDYADLTGKEEFRDRAGRMADWEIEVQLPCGGVQGGHYVGSNSDRQPVVFNTGQVILGWLRAYSETANEKYLNAAIRAGDWLLSVQSPDGAWRLDGPVVYTTVHAYDARTAWSLIEIDALVNGGKYAEAGRCNLDWTLAQQQENGWFRNNNFNIECQPPTHSISYVMEGLIESERLTGEARYLNAAIKTARKLASLFETWGAMPGELDGDWNAVGNYSCLTGNAQIAGVWLQLFQKTGEEFFLYMAIKLNNDVKAAQRLRSLHPGVRGGVRGSLPLHGRYQPYCYPNWAAKFLADSLMLEECTINSLKQSEKSVEWRLQAEAAMLQANPG
ncbi:MAG: hypothetical protein AB7U82_24105 [Blastocatellales bacterium]